MERGWESVNIRAIRGLIVSRNLSGSNQGRFKLQFEVKGQTYFLAFVEDERRWYVFAPTLVGVRRIPVYADTSEASKIVLAEEGKPTIMN